jgi:UDP-N-acetylmuramate--alanine ligase
MSDAIGIKNLLNAPRGSVHVYFLGIGGIGMSALARYFHHKGIIVSGYDKTETVLTKELIAEGIAVHYSEDVKNFPPDPALVVYTPAIPKEHAEFIFALEHNYKIVKRSDVLGAITAACFNICVAGTHGKTTISTMIAHILRHSEYGCNAFLGGIATNYETNFWSDENNVCVVEADEYDRSFLKLDPDIAVISAMDADHLDIYGDEETMQNAFIEFGNKVKEDGLFISKFGLKKTKEIRTKRKLSYSLQNEAANVFATDLQIDDGGYRFGVQLPDAVLSDLKLNIGGMHNVENVIAAIAVANELKIENTKIKNAVEDFKGVKRRFEYIIPLQQNKEGYNYPIFIDDYAHHPEELSALLKSVRSLFPQRIITVIFQPHLFTRTRDFQNEFASTLSIADSVILLPVYPARELPVEGVDSSLILKKIKAPQKQLLSKEELLEWMSSHIKNLDKEFGEVIITAGAGDIDKLVEPLKQIIQQA